MSTNPRWERKAALEPRGASAFIQWKGTDACLDLTCPCGVGGHLDGLFLYTVRCAGCGKLYDVGCFVALIEVPDGEGTGREHEEARVFGDE